MRLVLVIALVALAFSSLPALAVSLMDPFNLPAAMDSGTARVGDGIPFADGGRFRLDVYAPEQRGQAAPVLFFIYGGGWNRGERSDYQFVGRAFAARGFVVVIADYRHVPEVRFPEFLEDSARALAWVQANIASYGGDPNRLFLAGHSAGAYNAVMLALDPSYLQDFGVTLTIRGVAALSGPYDFYPFEYSEVIEAFGQAPNPEGTQPVNFITNQSPPMWLGTGTMDPIVRMQNTERFATRLRGARRLGLDAVLRGLWAYGAGDRHRFGLALARPGARRHGRLLQPVRRLPLRRTVFRRHPRAAPGTGGAHGSHRARSRPDLRADLAIGRTSRPLQVSPRRGPALHGSSGQARG
jgi:acetyl esterase/lipase